MLVINIHINILNTLTHHLSDSKKTVNCQPFKSTFLCINQQPEP